MLDREDISLGSRRTAQGVVLIDRSCGACAACQAGATLWCGEPRDVGRDLSPELPSEHAGQLAQAVLVLAALAAAPGSSAVLVLADPTGSTAVLTRALIGGRVIVAAEPASARDDLASEPTGRAQVVVARTDARTAVRAVRRGGHVCVPDTQAELPSVTELVQREVTLVAPLDVAGLADRITTELWAAAVSAAA